ncbi:MAG: hypothetical protein ACOYBQ_08500 [Fluviibacter sp.]
MKLKHHDISVSMNDSDVMLEQDIGCGESSVIVLAPDQVLAIADKLRGIVRPSPETEENRKLRVIADKLKDFVRWDGFYDCLTSHFADGVTYYQELQGIDDLVQEYAYGLRPDSQSQSSEPDSTEQAGGTVAKAEQGDLLDA